jgi:hypothetical protein
LSGARNVRLADAQADSDGGPEGGSPRRRAGDP